MGASTKIAWTDHTFNPWLGCTRISEGCRHCYAEALVEGRMGLQRWGAAPRVRTKQPWKDVLKWNRLSAEGIARGERRKRVFCASLADVFEDARGLNDLRSELWDVIEQCTSLDWQLLTKRPQRILRCLPVWWHRRMPEHVWIGTSIENQEMADLRVPELLRVPARVRFLSCEPLLERIDLRIAAFNGTDSIERLTDIGWVIVGGESGSGHRPMAIEWAQSLREQCRVAGVPFFFKQVSASRPGQGADALGEVVQEFPR